MSRPTTPPAGFRLHPLAAAAVLVVAVVLVYWNSLAAPFLFDDISAVAGNPTIRQLGTALTPPTDGSTTTGRPVVNLSFALNYAAGGTAVRGYHAMNIAIHAAAALMLFGLVRRTLAGPALTGKFGAQSLPLALGIAGLWALHPLQTESVTCISQRTESLCGLFCLATLYGFARGASAPRGGRWLILSVFACLLGMATKEVMVTTPVLVLLYDRTFVAGSFAGALRQRRGYYGALAATWLLLLWLLLGGGGTRGAAAGLGLGVSPWTYLLKQCEAIVLYLKLSLWPHPLVVDYGTGVVRAWTDVWWQGPLVLALLAGTAWALVRRPVIGFLGAWFFLILAPSSSIVPLVTQTMAEHRMYLPLAAILAFGVAGLWHLAGRRGLAGLLVLALLAGGLTIRRNRDFQSEVSLWSRTAADQPANPRVHTNLGIALTEAGQLEPAVAHFEESLRLQPDNASTHLNLCHALTRLGRAAEAVTHGEESLRLEPGSPDAHVNLANALALLGRTEAAVTHYEAALQIQPGAADVTSLLTTAHYTLGNQAATRGDFAGAIGRYRQALALTPDYPPARHNLANALLITDHVDEAITLYREILRQKPDDRRVQENLAAALERQRALRR